MLITLFLIFWVLYGLTAVALQYFNFCAPTPLLWPWYLAESLWDNFQRERLERDYLHRRPRH